MSGEVKYVTKKKKLGSYPSISVVASITLALFAIGVFGALVIYSKELEKVVKDTIKIQVYLKSQLSTEERLKIQKVFSSEYFLPREVANPIQYISKEEAASQFIKETGENFKKFLGENPLHDAYLIRISEAYQSPQSLTKIKKRNRKKCRAYSRFIMLKM